MSLREKKVSREFKKGISADESRRNRVVENLNIRSDTRSQQLERRRRQANIPNDEEDDDDNVSQSVTEQVDSETIKRNCLNLKSQSLDTVLDSTRYFRRILSLEKNPPISEVIASGAIPHLLELLNHHHHAIVFESAWALTNVASGTTEQTSIMVNLGAIPVFCKLLSSTNSDVREQAVWALGNIAGDSLEFRDMTIKEGALISIVQLCEYAFKLNDFARVTPLLRNCAWAFSNFCRLKPQPEHNLIAPAINTIAQLLRAPDKDMSCDSAWCLSYILDFSPDLDESIALAIHGRILESGAGETLIANIKSGNAAFITPCLRAIGNMLTGPDWSLGQLLSRGLLDIFPSILSARNRIIRKEACWAISNIAASTIPAHLEALIASGVVPSVLALAPSDERDVKKEVTWVIANIVRSKDVSLEILQYLVHINVINVIDSLLASSDSSMQIHLLSVLSILLERIPEAVTIVANVGGIETLENLQHSRSLEVYEAAQHILVRFFQAAEINDNLNPDSSSKLGDGPEDDDSFNNHFNF